MDLPHFREDFTKQNLMGQGKFSQAPNSDIRILPYIDSKKVTSAEPKISLNEV